MCVLFKAPLYQSIVRRSERRAWNLPYESFSWERRLKTSFSETLPPLPLKRYGLRKLSPNLNNFVKSSIVLGFRHLECINLSQTYSLLLRALHHCSWLSASTWLDIPADDMNLMSFHLIITLSYLFRSFLQTNGSVNKIVIAWKFYEDISKYHCVY